MTISDVTNVILCVIGLIIGIGFISLLVLMLIEYLTE